MFTIGRIVAAVMLLGASDKNPSNHPTLGLITFFIALYGLWRAYKTGRKGWLAGFGMVAILFNPFFQAPLNPSVWTFINIGTAILLIASIGMFRVHIRRSKEKKRERITVLPSGEILKDAEFEIKDDANSKKILGE